MAGSDGIISRSPMLGVFAVAVIAIVGGGVLALPMALYPFGPLLAGGLVVALGLVNIFTIGALATGISRSNAISSGRGRLISLTSEHLGRRAAAVSSSIATLYPGLAVLAYTLGVAATMPSLLGGSSAVWLVALGGVVMVVTLFQARQLFFASATVVSIINLTVLAIMIILIATRVEMSALTAAPDISGAGGLAAALGLVFGTILFSFFGHSALFVVAQPALRADPSGQALRRGAMLAMLIATVINSVWVMACLAVIPAEDYATETGTGLGLLTDAIGPEMRVLGLIFLILAPGLGAVSSSFQLSGAIDERLPRLRRLDTVLRDGAAVEVLDAATGAVIIVTRIDDYLVASGHYGRSRDRQTITDTTWSAAAMLEQLGISRRGCWLRMDVLGEVADGTAIEIETSMNLRELTPERKRHDFIGTGSDAEELRNRVITRCIRHPSTIAELAEQLDTGPVEVETVVTALVAEGRLTPVVDDTGTGERYRALLGTRQRAKSAVVAALFSDLVAEESDADERRRSAVPGLLNSLVARRLIISVPTLIALFAVAALLVAGISFAALLNLNAMAAITLLGGGLPILLNLSLRARAERSVDVGRIIQARWLNLGIFVMFCIICALYAAVIYETILNRVVAAAVLGLFLWLYIRSSRSGAFRPRSAISLELRRDGGLRVDAVDNAASRQVEAPSTVDPTDRQLRITIPDGLRSPVVITAIDGETVPARLGAFTASTADGATVTGRLEDTLGTEVTLGSGDLTVVWQLS